MNDTDRKMELNGGYKMLLKTMLNGMDSLRDDFKDYGDKNDLGHIALGQKIDGVQKELGDFIKNDFNKLNTAVAIRGAIAGFVAAVIPLIVGGIVIWKFVTNLLPAGTP